MNLSDILLLPKKLYEKITGKRHTLILGIILVGIADMVFTIYGNHTRILTGKAPVILYYNITLTVVATILVGFIDVLFFSLPVFDLFKRFGREKSIQNAGEQLVKLMKVYILANLLVLPVNILFYYLFGNDTINRSSFGVMLAYAYILVIPIWISAAVSRGAGVIYGFVQPLKKIAFMVVFIWSSLLSVVLGYIVDHWIMALFR